MRKIIRLYQINFSGECLVRDEVTPAGEWVIAGEGVATRKFDGTCCLIRDGILYKRYDARAGKQPPDGFEPAQNPDPLTGHWPGWLVVGHGPEDRWHVDAASYEEQKTVRPFMTPPGYLLGSLCLADGTYELCGPKVQGNPEGFARHTLVRHGCEELPDCPRDFVGLRDYLLARTIEGVVWHHPDGRMVKARRRDFVNTGPRRTYNIEVLP